MPKNDNKIVLNRGECIRIKATLLARLDHLRSFSKFNSSEAIESIVSMLEAPIRCSTTRQISLKELPQDFFSNAFLYTQTLELLKKRLSLGCTEEEFQSQYKKLIYENTLLDTLKITIDKKQDKFFIALAQENDWPFFHAFVILGVIHAGKVFFLSRVDKVADLDECFYNNNLEPSAAILLKYLFSRATAELVTSNFYRATKTINYNYAYSISLATYLQYVNTLSKAQRIMPAQCYQLENQDDEKATLVSHYLPVPQIATTEEEALIIERSHYLDVNNTCCSSAVDLLKDNFHHRPSRAFYKTLALTINFEGTNNNCPYFYLFPASPQTFSVDDRTRKALKEIYERMHDLLKLAPNHRLTYQKFVLLSNLYHQLTTSSTDHKQSLQIIRECRTRNDECINHLRDQSFFSRNFIKTSATKRMFNRIEEKLENGHTKKRGCF